jgi:hypothetical protein
MVGHVFRPMQPLKITALERRKAHILDHLRATGGEIWAGDIANYGDLEKWRPAFESLVTEGVLTKRKAEKSSRLYYSLKSDAE